VFENPPQENEAPALLHLICRHFPFSLNIVKELALQSVTLWFLVLDDFISISFNDACETLRIIFDFLFHHRHESRKICTCVDSAEIDRE
jgi:hypothetical protein